MIGGLRPTLSDRLPTNGMTMTATGGRDFTVTVNLKLGVAAVSGVRVTVVITDPRGSKATYTATTNSAGTATVKDRLSRWGARGTYRVTATATSSGQNASVSGSFVY